MYKSKIKIRLNKTKHKEHKRIDIKKLKMIHRSKIDYSLSEQQIMKNDKQIILLKFENKKLKKIADIFDNQEKTSLQIVSNLHDRKIINVMVLAKTQSGKTGAMSALIKNFLNDTTILIPIENIYIITGLSSREWIIQTKNRMPKSLEDRVFHRDKLTTSFVDDIKDKKNILVIIDEIQVAAKRDQTLNKCFEKAKFYDKNHLLKNDIKIIEFTATPDGILYDQKDWGENSCKIIMESGEDYVGAIELLNDNRVYQYKDLICYNSRSKTFDKEKLNNNLNEINEIIKIYKKPKYHIIRTPNGSDSKKVINNINNFFGDKIITITYDKESDIIDINNELLNVKPKIHTFIFIKEKLRCAKTLTKKYLGILYERYTKCPNDAVIIQGLIGRATGYDKHNKCIVFTNIESIVKYNKLWISKFENKTVDWNSNTTRKDIKGKLISKPTFNHTKNFIKDNKLIKEKYVDPTINKFKTFDESKKYIKDKLGRRQGPHTPKIDTDGYYRNAINRKRRILSCDDVKKQIRNSLNTKNYICYRCYRDTKDKSTLEFWVVHY